jgi:probable F420-dependent oxidoreductase
VQLDAVLPPLDLSAIPETARAAEALGFSALWTAETQHDPFLPLALAAEHTSRVQLGTAIAVSFARSPATLAYTAWDLAAQSGGRFILGLGTQVKAHIERRFGMEWPASVTGKLREQILAIRAFWDCWQNGTKLNFRGDYYKLRLMSPFFAPPPLPSSVSRFKFSEFGGSGAGDEGIIPIYIAGVNPGLPKLAGELCEGFHVHPLNSPRYLHEVILPAIETGAEKVGRSRQDLEVTVSTFVATTRDEQEAARRQISFYASTPSYRPVMALYGWSDVAGQLSMHAARGEWSLMPALVRDEMLAEFCTIAASPADLAGALKARYSGIADRIVPYRAFVAEKEDAFWKALISTFKS